MINAKPFVTPKEEPERDRSSMKKSVIQGRPSKYFESEEAENMNSKKIVTLVQMSNFRILKRT
jgi:hypothetical protein